MSVPYLVSTPQMAARMWRSTPKARSTESKAAAIFFKQCAALLDALIRDQDVQIVPEGFGKFRLVVEQVHDPQIGRERSGVIVKHASRNAAPRRLRPQLVNAGMKVCRRCPDCVGGHQRMTRGARFPTPGRWRLLGGRWRKRRRSCWRTVLCALPKGNAARDSRDPSRNKYRPRFMHAFPVSAHYPKTMADPISFQWG